MRLALKTPHPGTPSDRGKVVAGHPGTISIRLCGRILAGQGLGAPEADSRSPELTSQFPNVIVSDCVDLAQLPEVCGVCTGEAGSASQEGRASPIPRCVRNITGSC